MSAWSSRVRIDIEYDGTGYSGWQRQPNKKTIQSELESALGVIFGSKISVVGSGRTDAGVHALNQVAHFDLPKAFEVDKLAKAMCANLPKDIVVKKAIYVPDNFHARKSCVKKSYLYKVISSQSPVAILRNYLCYTSDSIDLVYLNDLSSLFVGTHDFESFRASDANTKTSIRTVYTANWYKNENYIEFLIEANGFLKQMIRNLVGTLLYMHSKKLPKLKFLEILEAKDRTKAFNTASAHALYLKGAYFDKATTDTLPS